MIRFSRGLAALGAALLLCSATEAQAHGFAGERDVTLGSQP